MNNPLRHTNRGWFWGSVGPQPTREKMINQVKAIYARGYRGNPQSMDHWIDDLVGTFTDPIIVMPGGWGETLPDWIKKRISLERMIENQKGILGKGTPTASDLEAMAYLYTASLAAPMGHDWANIYLYISAKEMAKERGQELSAAEKQSMGVPDHLTIDQQRDLADLKRFIYDSRLKARAAKRRGEKLADEKLPTVAQQRRIMTTKDREEASAARRRQSAAPAPPAAETREHYEPPSGTKSRQQGDYQTRKAWLPEGVKMWMITPQQFLAWQKARYPNTDDAELFQWKGEHRREVAKALVAKLPVPKDVMQAYPSLMQYPERAANPTDILSQVSPTYRNFIEDTLPRLTKWVYGSWNAGQKWYDLFGFLNDWAELVFTGKAVSNQKVNDLYKEAKAIYTQTTLNRDDFYNRQKFGVALKFAFADASKNPSRLNKILAIDALVQAQHYNGHVITEYFMSTALLPDTKGGYISPNDVVNRILNEVNKALERK